MGYRMRTSTGTDATSKWLQNSVNNASSNLWDSRLSFWSSASVNSNSVKSIEVEIRVGSASADDGVCMSKKNSSTSARLLDVIANCEWDRGEIVLATPVYCLENERSVQLFSEQKTCLPARKNTQPAVIKLLAFDSSSQLDPIVSVLRQTNPTIERTAIEIHPFTIDNSNDTIVNRYAK